MTSVFVCFICRYPSLRHRVARSHTEGREEQSLLSCGSLSLLSGSLCLSLSCVSGFLSLLSCLSSSLSLSGSDFGALLSDSLSLSLVLLYFLVEGSFRFSLLGVALLVANSLELGVLLVLPSLETALSLSLVKSTFLDATHEVFHHQDAFA